jgi:hypothetical protein
VTAASAIRAIVGTLDVFGFSIGWRGGRFGFGPQVYFSLAVAVIDVSENHSIGRLFVRLTWMLLQQRW